MLRKSPNNATQGLNSFKHHFAAFHFLKKYLASSSISSLYLTGPTTLLTKVANSPTPEVLIHRCVGRAEGNDVRRSPDLLFLHIFHHAVNALLWGHMSAVDQRVGCGVEILTTVEKQELGIWNGLEGHNHKTTSVSKPVWTDCSIPPVGWWNVHRGHNVTVLPSQMWNLRALRLQSDLGVRVLEKLLYMQPCLTWPPGRSGGAGVSDVPYRKCFVNMWRLRWQMTAPIHLRRGEISQLLF